MEWRSGKIGKNIELIKRLNGTRLSEETLTDRCGEIVNLLLAVDRDLGGKLMQDTKILTDRDEFSGSWNNLMRQGFNVKVNVEVLFEKQLKLLGKSEKIQSPREISHSIDLFCPRCLNHLGKLQVTLRLIDEPELLELTKNDLIKLKASRETMSQSSKRMGFENIKQLEDYLDDTDAQKAAGILEKTITELEGLVLDYDRSKIVGVIRSQVTEITKEARRRKIEFLDTVEKIVKERVHIIA